MPVTLTCAECGSKFHVKPSRAKSGAKYCSQRCNGASRTVAALSTRNCLYCGTSFTWTACKNPTRKYCSSKCWGLHRGAKARRQSALRTEKQCTQCGMEKPLAQFYVSSGALDGKMSECAACRRRRNRKYYKTNRRLILRSVRSYYFANRERISQRTRRYVEAHKSETKARKRQYYIKNRDHARMRGRRYYQANKWRHSIASSNRRARIRGACGAHDWADIVRLWHRQTGECARCGVKFGKRPKDRGYHVDHVTPLSRGGSNWPRNLQLLCESSNCSKLDKTPAEYTLYLIQTGQREPPRGFFSR